MRAKIGLLAGLLAIGLGLVGPAAADDAKPTKSGPKTILFLGDSITRDGRYAKMIAGELAKQGGPNAWQCVFHGRNSETVSNLSEAYHPGRRPCVLDRLDAELKATKPDWVVACYGINCGIYHPFDEKRFTAYKEGVEKFIAKAHAAGAKVIFLTAPPYGHTGPFPANSDAAAREAIFEKANTEAAALAEKDPNKFGYRTPFEYYDFVMERYAKWLLTLNGRKDAWTIDLRAPILARAKETHGRDAIHPNNTGHALMAEAFMKQWPAIQEQASK